MTTTTRTLARQMRTLERQIDRIATTETHDPFPTGHLEPWEADLLAAHLARHRTEGPAYFDTLTREGWSAVQYIVGRMMRPTRPVDARFRPAEVRA